MEQMKRNPKNTKQEIKFIFFYFTDLVIIVCIMMLASYVAKILLLGAMAKVLLYIVAAALGIFLCIKPFSSPTNRNMKVIMDMFKMDRRKFDSIEIAETYSITEVKNSRRRAG